MFNAKLVDPTDPLPAVDVEALSEVIAQAEADVAAAVRAFDAVKHEAASKIVSRAAALADGLRSLRIEVRRE